LRSRIALSQFSAGTPKFEPIPMKALYFIKKVHALSSAFRFHTEWL
jgi:hypothetical protein